MKVKRIQPEYDLLTLNVLITPSFKLLCLSRNENVFKDSDFSSASLTDWDWINF